MPIDPIRKAAILISVLDVPSADALLDRMHEGLAQRVRDAVIELRDVSPSEEERVLTEFVVARGGELVEPAGGDADGDADGIELQGALAALRTTDPPGSAGGETSPAPFRFLHEASIEALAGKLANEHPQVVAVVVAHLPPERAAELIETLGPALRVEVLRRVAELDSADPHVLQELEQQLRLLLADDIRAARRRHAGVAAVSSILNAAGRSRGALLSQLEQRDQVLAEQVVRRNREPARSDPPPAPEPQRAEERAPEEGPPAAQPAAFEPIPLDAVTALPDRDLALLFSHLEPDVAIVALVGAEPELVDRIARLLPSRDAKHVRRQMERVGPLKLADIEEAQRRVGLLAAELQASGRLEVPARRPFAAAA